jgi:hypothetical protein
VAGYCECSNGLGLREMREIYRLSEDQDTDKVYDTKHTTRKITQENGNFINVIYFAYITNDKKVDVF